MTTLPNTKITNYEQNEYTNQFIFLSDHNLLFEVLKYLFDWDNTGLSDFKLANLQKLIPLMKTNKTVFELVLRALNENRSHMNINYINFFKKPSNNTNTTEKVYKFRDEIKKQLKAKNLKWFNNHRFLFHELTLSNTLIVPYGYITITEFYNLIKLMGYNYLRVIKIDLGSFIPKILAADGIPLPNNVIDIRDKNVKESNFIKYIKRKHNRKRKYLLKGYYYLELDNLITVLNDNYIVNVKHEILLYRDTINYNDFIEYLNKININNLSIKFYNPKFVAFNTNFNIILEKCINKQINMFELNLYKMPETTEIPLRVIQNFIHNNDVRYFKFSNYYCEFERCTQLISWFDQLEVDGVLYELNRILYDKLNEFNVELFQNKIKYILKNIENPQYRSIIGFGMSYNILRVMAGMRELAYAS